LAEVLSENNDQSYRLIQITDSHLFADRATIFDGLNTFDTLMDVVDLVSSREPSIDCLLCTGDLAQDSSTEAYLNFLAAVSILKAPQLWIPGNHDIRSNMQQALSQDSINLKRSVQLGKWQVIMLDSSVEGQVYGLLDQKELADLDLELADSERSNAHVLVCVHHNCIPVEAAWLQQHCLKNSDELFSILDKYTHVRGVLYGHIHQEIEVEYKEIKIMATPSTCIQFHPNNDDFTIDNEKPAYRWLDLMPDGEIKTGVERVVEKSYSIDFESTGY
jgi:Icc protein